MSADELKQQLVDCIRMLEQSDIIDYNGHCSIRLDDGRILINIGSCQRSRLTVDDICTIDLEANQLEGKGNAPLERHLHCGIYRVRPDVKAIVHAHPKWSTFLTMVGESYKPVYAQGSLVHPMPPAWQASASRITTEALSLFESVSFTSRKDTPVAWRFCGSESCATK